MNKDDKEFEDFWKYHEMSYIKDNKINPIPKDVARFLFGVMKKKIKSKVRSIPIPIPAPQPLDCDNCDIDNNCNIKEKILLEESEIAEIFLNDIGLPDLSRIVRKFIKDGISPGTFLLGILIKEIRLLKEVLKND